MIRMLPQSPRGTWLLAGAVWLAGCGAFWWAVPYRPRVSWPTDNTVVHGFIPGTSVLLTSSGGNSGFGGPTGPGIGPVLARDAETGRLSEWIAPDERLTLVEPGVDGRHVLICRVIGGWARLFVHDASNGKIIAELPRDGPRVENVQDVPRDVPDQFARFCPDGRRVVYGDRVGDQPRLRVWDMDAKQEVAVLPDAGPPAAWSPDGQSLAYVMQGRQEPAVGLWDVHAGRKRTLALPALENRRPVHIHFSPDGRSVVCVLEQAQQPHAFGPFHDVEIVGWDVALGRQVFRRNAEWAAFPAGVPWFATQDQDQPGNQVLQRRDYATGNEQDRVVLREMEADLWGGFSPDGGLVLGDDVLDNPVFEFLDQHVLNGALGTIVRPVLWETGSGRLRHVLPMAIDTSPTGHAWSADGTLLAIAGEDDLMVWDIPPRRSLKWFMAAAALLALPLHLIARRQVRRLRPEAAA
jgi:hypothetical protein